MTIIPVCMQWTCKWATMQHNELSQKKQHLTIMINVQRISARTTRTHSFLIFNMYTKVGGLWPWKPSSIMLTSCFISFCSFFAKGSSPQVCYLGFLNGCHWACLDNTAVFVSDVYLYEVFAPPHYSCMYPLVHGKRQEIKKKNTLTAVTSHELFKLSNGPSVSITKLR